MQHGALIMPILLRSRIPGLLSLLAALMLLAATAPVIAQNSADVMPL